MSPIVDRPVPTPAAEASPGAALSQGPTPFPVQALDEDLARRGWPVAGQGVALVRRALVANELATRRLYELFPGRSWPIRWAYYVVAAPQALRRREVAAFYDWLVEDVSAASMQIRSTA